MEELQLKGDGELSRDPPRLRVVGVSMSFAGTPALTDVHFEVNPGEIHALVGQNGAGKSTLVKILSGFWNPQGEPDIEVDGERLSLPISPRELRRVGFAFVHQDLGLVDHLTVLDNLHVGSFRVRRVSRMIRRQVELQAARASLSALGCDVDPLVQVAQLSATERALLAIARALENRRDRGGVIVFDEATRSLPYEATQVVHQVLRQVAAEGTSIILISHRLDEVLELADRVTVLRDGRIVHSGQRLSGVSRSRLASMILGYDLAPHPARVGPPSSSEEPFVHIIDVKGKWLKGLTLGIAAGEIVGLSGVPGEGYDELPYLLADIYPSKSGRLTVGGKSLDLGNTRYSDLLNNGVAIVPERRELYGLVATMSIRENVSLPRVKSHSSTLMISRSWERSEAAQVIETLM